MNKSDRLALLLSILSVFLSYLVTVLVFEGIPHLEDEITYVWQARLINYGHIKIDSPICPKCFLQPFVIDFQGSRFGKYPLGWPAMLSIAIKLGLRQFINPLLAGFSTWLTYLLGKRLFDVKTAFLAVFLQVFSPFFLILSGSLLSHTWSLFLVLSFILGWLDITGKQSKTPSWLPLLVSSISLGLLVLTRPLTAIGISLPFILHGVIKFFKGSRETRIRLLIFILICLSITALHLLWQQYLTGDFLLNPYILYWEYDKIGFGPSVGLQQGGFSPYYAYWNTWNNLRVGISELFGWPYLSWLFLPFGLIAIRKNRKAILVCSAFMTLLIAYGFYWIGAWVLGPRYYFEAIFSLVFLSASGINWLSGTFKDTLKLDKRNPWKKIRYILVNSIWIILLIGNLLFYLPNRLKSLQGLYGINKTQLSPFLTQEALDLTPALIIVHPQYKWLEYGALLDLSSPMLDSPYVFVYHRGEILNQQVIEQFPDRSIWHYYTGDPYQFYTDGK
ncbi:MAG: hypothetical protein JEZ06_08535 [Anaerolineaceae bacterium]|nr:hypothetical protein [Anaerolineaceae bacterium]